MKRKWLEKFVSLFMALILLLTPFSGMTVLAEEADNGSLSIPAGMSAKNWMGYLPNTADLATFSLPGTANSGTQEMMTLNYMVILQSLVDQMKLTDNKLVQDTILPMVQGVIEAAEAEEETTGEESPLKKINVPLNCIAKCQTQSIPEQMENGVRLLDVRCSEFREGGTLILTNGGIKCVHKEKKDDDDDKDDDEDEDEKEEIIVADENLDPWDAENHSLTFNTVLEQAKQFVKDNPTETVVMVVSGEPFFFPSAPDDANLFVKIVWTALREAIKTAYSVATLSLDLDKIDDWAEADLQEKLHYYAYGSDTHEAPDDQIISVFDDRTPFPTVGQARGKVVLVNKKDLTDSDFGAAQTSGDPQIDFKGKWQKIQAYLNNVGKQNYEGDKDKIRGDKLCPAVVDTTCFGTLAEFCINGAIAYMKNGVLKTDEKDPEDPDDPTPKPTLNLSKDQIIEKARESIMALENKTADEKNQILNAFNTNIAAANLSDVPGLDEIKEMIKKEIYAALPPDLKDAWDKVEDSDSATSAISDLINWSLETVFNKMTNGTYIGWFFMNYVKGEYEIPEKVPVPKLMYLLNEFDFNRNNATVEYLSEMAVAYDPDMNTAVDKLKADGYTIVSDASGKAVNMNEIGNSLMFKDIRNWTSTPTINGKTAKSPFAVALGYKTSKDPHDAITGMYWTYRKDDSTAVDDADQKIIKKYDYQLVKKASTEFTHSDIKNDDGYADLNISTNTDNDIVNLYYSKDPRLGERVSTIEGVLTYYKTIKDPNTGKIYPQADRDKADARVKENQKNGYLMPLNRYGKPFCSNQTRAFNDVYLMHKSVFPDFEWSRVAVAQNMNMRAQKNPTWQTDSTEDLVFRINIPIKYFNYVTINDEVLDPSNYTVTEGSTIIALHNDYLKTLKPGNYVLKAYFDVNGEEIVIPCDFSIVPPDDNVATGITTSDNSNLTGALIAVLTAICIGGVLWIGKLVKSE